MSVNDPEKTKWYSLYHALNTIADDIVKNLTLTPIQLEDSAKSYALPASISLYNNLNTLYSQELDLMDAEHDKDEASVGYNQFSTVEETLEHFNRVGTTDYLHKASIHEQQASILTRTKAEFFIHYILPNLPQSIPGVYDFSDGYPGSLPSEIPLEQSRDFFLGVLLDGLAALLTERHGYPADLTDDKWEEHLTIMMDTFNKMRYHPDGFTWRDRDGMNLYVEYYLSLWD